MVTVFVGEAPPSSMGPILDYFIRLSSPKRTAVWERILFFGFFSACFQGPSELFFQGGYLHISCH